MKALVLRAQRRLVTLGSDGFVAQPPAIVARCIQVVLEHHHLGLQVGNLPLVGLDILIAGGYRAHGCARRGRQARRHQALGAFRQLEPQVIVVCSRGLEVRSHACHLLARPVEVGAQLGAIRLRRLQARLEPRAAASPIPPVDEKAYQPAQSKSEQKIQP